MRIQGKSFWAHDERRKVMSSPKNLEETIALLRKKHEEAVSLGKRYPVTYALYQTWKEVYGI
jgi:hypothetical protein